MKRNIVLLMMTMLCTLFFATSISYASTLRITGFRTDTMEQFDTIIPAGDSGLMIPRKESTKYWPAYPKPDKYVFIKILKSGIRDFNSNLDPKVTTLISSEGSVDTYRIQVLQPQFSSFIGPQSIFVYGYNDPLNGYTLMQINIQAWDSTYSTVLKDSLAGAFTKDI